MPTKTWQSLERFAASIFGSTRNPLSGANNRNDRGEKRIGDVICPPNVNYFIECKHKARFAFHSLFRKAQEDAPDRTLFLFTHQKQERYQDSMVTMNAFTFARIWPYIKHLFEVDLGDSDTTSTEGKETPQ